MSEIDGLGMTAAKRLGVVVTFTLLCGAIFAFLWTNSGGNLPLVDRDGYRVSVDVPRVGNVVYFSDVMVAGVKVGKVVDVREQGDSARVVLELDDTAAPLHEGATALIGAKSLVEESFVEITDGDGAELASGTVLPEGSATPPTQLDDVLATLDEPTRDSLRGLLRSMGEGTKGNKDEIAAAVAGLGDLGREGATVLDALAAQSDDIEGMTRNATRLLAAMAERRDQTSVLVGHADTVLKVTAGQDEDVRETLRALPPLLQTASESSDDLTRLGESLAPVAENLTVAAPHLTAALNQLPATARDLRATMPALDKVLRRSPDTLERVPGFTADLDALLPPAQQVLSDANPMLGYLAPYGPDIAGHFANFAQTLATGDANGKAFRVMPVMNEQSLKAMPFSTNLGPLAKFNPYPGAGTLLQPHQWQDDDVYPRVEREEPHN